MAASTHDSGQNKRLQWSGVTGRVLMESQLTPPTEPYRSGIHTTHGRHGNCRISKTRRKAVLILGAT